MKKMNDLTDLFSEQLKELYNAEKQQQEILQKFIKKSDSTELKTLNQKVYDKTELHIKRLEKALEMLGETKRGNESKAMKELLDRGLTMAKSCENTEVLEAALVTSIQGVKHFEIVLYGTLIAFADLLGKKEVSDLLKKSLDEEKSLDKELTLLAEKTVNRKAKNPALVGVY